MEKTLMDDCPIGVFVETATKHDYDCVSPTNRQLDFGRTSKFHLLAKLVVASVEFPECEELMQCEHRLHGQIQMLIQKQKTSCWVRDE